jgi:hypothetical protein
MLVGLVVHRIDLGLHPVARDVIGDALWAMMMFWLIGALMPRARWQARALFALAICFTVEISQLYHSAAIDGIRATALGHLVLGQGFDPRDFLAYALGVAVAALLDPTIRS